jgi:hypothetical protein
VVGGLSSPGSQREYGRAIDEFVAWYCSEPRLSFSKTVVTRFRIHLEERPLAPATINLRLAAVRRLAYEAADSGLLSPELATGIRRVKGVKKLGVRLGNWLTQNEARSLWQVPDPNTPEGRPGPSDPGHPAGLRTPSSRARRSGDRPHPTARGALGHRGSNRQGRPYPHRPHAGLGQAGN